MGAIKDISGKVFGKLTVSGFSHLATHGKYQVAMWNCQCQCGAFTVVVGANLRSGKTKSCGCARLWRTEHGLTRHPLAMIWRGMMQRCYDPKGPSYPRYGAVGITVCERWQDIRNFVSDMHPRPSLNHTMDRINNSLGYFPENVRWATKTEQQANRKGLTNIECSGETYNLSEWARRVKRSRTAIRYYWERHGCSPQDAIRHYVKLAIMAGFFPLSSREIQTLTPK